MLHNCGAAHSLPLFRAVESHIFKNGNYSNDLQGLTGARFTRSMKVLFVSGGGAAARTVTDVSFSISV